MRDSHFVPETQQALFGAPHALAVHPAALEDFNLSRQASLRPAV